MKRYLQFSLFLALALLATNTSFSQTYTHPTVGIQSEFVGSCLVADSGPFTYTDNNSGGNYSTNVILTYRVFCPSVAFTCMQVTFNSFNVEGGWDFLQVSNGPTQNSPQFMGAPTGGTAYGGWFGISGIPAVPFSYTSTDASGCLTFRFYSDGTVTRPGWSATITGIPCAGGPNGTDNNDCSNVTPLCSAATITGNASGPGILAEGCTGSTCPAGGENHSNWYTFTAQTAGIIDLMINPGTNTDDYDYAIYGPNVTCGALGVPLNCSDSGIAGNTGIQNTTPNEFSEDVNGDGFTESITANAGDSYILVVDEWSANAGSGYQLSFGGTASLDCSVLPVELYTFEAEYMPESDKIGLHWLTSSERDNDRFELEHSEDGVNFKIINILEGAGTTNSETEYFAIHDNPITGTNYYRLNQWDIDGNGTYSEVISVNVLDDAYDMLSLFPNPTNGLTEVIYNSYKKEEVMLNVVSFDGRTIINTSIKAERGGNRFDLDMSDQKNGIYFITITTNEKTYRSKLIKK
jgi:hypothetical protein